MDTNFWPWHMLPNNSQKYHCCRHPWNRGDDWVVAVTTPWTCSNCWRRGISGIAAWEQVQPFDDLGILSDRWKWTQVTHDIRCMCNFNQCQTLYPNCKFHHFTSVQWLVATCAKIGASQAAHISIFLCVSSWNGILGVLIYDRDWDTIPLLASLRVVQTKCTPLIDTQGLVCSETKVFLRCSFCEQGNGGDQRSSLQASRKHGLITRMHLLTW